MRPRLAAGRSPAPPSVEARPNIRAVRPPVTIRAPGRSDWVALAGAALSFGRILSATMRAAAPTGTLIQKMSCQPAQVVTASLTRTPAAIPETAPSRPVASGRR